MLLLTNPCLAVAFDVAVDGDVDAVAEKGVAAAVESDYSSREELMTDSADS
jgi:hypothetical protein